MNTKLINGLFKALYLWFLFRIVLFAFFTYHVGFSNMLPYYSGLTLSPFSLAVYLHIGFKCWQTLDDKKVSVY